MPSVYVKFKNYNQLTLRINDCDIGKKYCALVWHNYEKSRPIFRDRPRYTVEYMLELAQQAKSQLNWDWSFDHYDVSITTLLHKDIETLVGNGFADIPKELDDLIHELHYCLHIIQDNNPNRRRDGWLQIEWFNDDGFPLPGTDLFKQKLTFGDLRLQNPYVGHGPLQIFMEKDFSNIPQTCKFHNFVKPGINISIRNYLAVNPQTVLESFKTHSPAFVDLHTPEKILRYTGYPVIGAVENLTDLHLVATAPVLELEYIDFDE